MVLEDKIFGKVKVSDPILLDLLKTPSLLRLKKISQFGIPDKYYHHQNFNRYEHSLGVMLLLKRLGATTEEQVAGLLHDVSVSAFSHIADWVFSKGKDGIENYHDLIHQEFVKNTEIPKLLKQHGLLVDRILDEHNFSLLEREIPDLCADRVDYALREFNNWLDLDAAKSCLTGLTNYNGEIVFNDPKTALLFATRFLELQTKHWGEYEAIVRYHLFSKALLIALEKKIIIKEDFYKDEEFILSKIGGTNIEIRKIFGLLRKKEIKSLDFKLNQKIFKKFRYVDPKVIVNGDLKRLSQLNNKFKRLIEKQKNISKTGISI